MQTIQDKVGKRKDNVNNIRAYIKFGQIVYSISEIDNKQGCIYTSNIKRIRNDINELKLVDDVEKSFTESYKLFLENSYKNEEKKYPKKKQRKQKGCKTNPKLITIKKK